MAKCCTDRKVINYSYQWNIKQFSIRVKEISQKISKMTILKSSSFSVPVSSGISWHFEIRLTENTSYNPTGIGIRLVYVTDKVDIIPNSVSLKYFFVNAKKQNIEVYCQNIVELLTHMRNSVYIKLYDMAKLLQEADIYLPNDELTIVCRMIIATDTTFKYGDPNVSDVIINNPSNDFANLLKSDDISDITFQISDRKLRAHKAILAARSPVFFAMFKHPMQEQNSNVVTIEDVEPEIFEAMLEYIYTNNVSDIDCTAKYLLPIADQYDLKGLVKLCVMSLCKNVTVDNVAEIYILAERHNTEELLEYMQNFMSANLVNVMKTPVYETIEKDHPQLLIKFLRKLF